MRLSSESLRAAGAFLAITVVAVAAPANAGPVTFETRQFACDLTVDNQPRGHLEVDKPVTIDLPPKVEYLIQCESHELPVKVYARNYLTAGSHMPNAPMSHGISILPIAVLPNLVRAASAQGMEIIAATDVHSIDCKLSEGSSFGLQEGQPKPSTTVRTVASGTKVKLTGNPPIHCGETNLIEVQGPGWRAWFPNKAFTFSFQGRKIEVFAPSQNDTCCWIE
jgi:hypothetical protein